MRSQETAVAAPPHQGVHRQFTLGVFVDGCLVCVVRLHTMTSTRSFESSSNPCMRDKVVLTVLTAGT